MKNVLVVSLDIDGTMEFGEPPGPITVALVRELVDAGFVVGCGAALLVLEPLQSTSESGQRRSAWAGTLPIVVAAVVAALLARNVPALPKLLVAYGRYAATRAQQDIDVIEPRMNVHARFGLGRRWRWRRH